MCAQSLNVTAQNYSQKNSKGQAAGECTVMTGKKDKTQKEQSQIIP